MSRVMAFVMNCNLELFDDNLRLDDVDDIVYSHHVKSYQVLKSEDISDRNLEKDSSFISTFKVSNMMTDMRVNLIGELFVQDDTVYLDNISFNVRAYEFYEIHDVLYLLKDIVSEILPNKARFEISTSVEYKVGN